MKYPDFLTVLNEDWVAFVHVKSSRGNKPAAGYLIKYWKYYLNISVGANKDSGNLESSTFFFIYLIS